MTAVISRLRSRLDQSGFLKVVLLLASGTAAGQVLVIISAPLLSRMYSPDDFGALAVFTSLTSTIAVVSALRFELAIPLPEDRRMASSLLAVAMAMNIVTGVVLSGALLLGGDALLSLTGVPNMPRYGSLLVLTIFAYGVYETLTYWGLREKDYGHLALTSASQSAGQVGAQVALGGFGLKPAGLLAGMCIGRFAGIGMLGERAWRRYAAEFRSITLADMRAAASRYRRFPLASSASGLLMTLGMYVPVVLLGRVYGAAAAGLYFLGYRVIAAPMTLIGLAVAQVYLAEAAGLRRTDPSRLRKLFTATTKRLCKWSVGPFAVFALVAPWLFGRFFGPYWQEAGVYAQIVVPMFFLQFVVAPMSHTLTVLEEQAVQLAWNVGRTVLGCLAFVIPGALGWSAREALLCYSASMTVSYAVYLYLIYSAVRRLDRGESRRDLPSDEDSSTRPTPGTVPQ